MLLERFLTGRSACAPHATQSESGAFLVESRRPDRYRGRSQADHLRGDPSEASIRLDGSECRDITYTHRRLGDQDIFFLINNADQAREVQISLRCDGAPYMLDLETGAAVALPDCTQRGGRTMLLRRMDAGEPLLIYFDSEPALIVGPRRPIDGRSIKLSNKWDFQAQQLNCLMLRPCDQSQTAFRAMFDVEVCPGELLLITDGNGDGPAPGQVVINGVEATVPRPRKKTSAALKALDIAPLVRGGLNEVIISPGVGSARLMEISVSDDEQICSPRTSLADGSWTEQGYPFYSGVGVYTQIVEIPKVMPSERIFLRSLEPADTVEFVETALAPVCAPGFPSRSISPTWYRPAPTR